MALTQPERYAVSRTLQRAAAGVSTEDLILPFFRLSREDSYLGTERRFSRR